MCAFYVMMSQTRPVVVPATSSTAAAGGTVVPAASSDTNTRPSQNIDDSRASPAPIAAKAPYHNIFEVIQGFKSNRDVCFRCLNCTCVAVSDI